MQGIGLPHLIILLIILLVFFGPSRLPQFGQSLGKAIRGFKDGLNEIEADSKDVSPQNQLNQNTDPAKQAQQQKTETKNNS